MTFSCDMKFNKKKNCRFKFSTTSHRVNNLSNLGPPQKRITNKQTNESTHNAVDEKKKTTRKVLKKKEKKDV